MQFFVFPLIRYFFSRYTKLTWIYTGFWHSRMIRSFLTSIVRNNVTIRCCKGVTTTAGFMIDDLLAFVCYSFGFGLVADRITAVTDRIWTKHRDPSVLVEQ